jgi:NADH-quinone oxidoreductase subunit E
MLTQEELAAISEGCDSSPSARAAAPHALGAVQASRGWISDESLSDIADLLHMTPAELDSIATFYNRIYRSPVGRHVILLCDSVSCWIMDYEYLLNHLLTKLGISAFGETTKDGMFTLLPSACLGACDHAPAMMVDQELFGDLTRQSIDTIIDQYRNKDGDRRTAQFPLATGRKEQ